MSPDGIRGVFHFGTFSLGISLRRQELLVLLPQLFAELHLPFVPDLGLVPIAGSLNFEALVKVRKPAVEFPLDGKHLGALPRLPRRAVSKTLRGAVDPHQPLHLLVGDAVVAFGFLRFVEAPFGRQLPLRSQLADGVSATVGGLPSAVVRNLRFLNIISPGRRRRNCAGAVLAYVPLRGRATHCTERHCSDFVRQFGTVHHRRSTHSYFQKITRVANK
mmetsp:Transcript_59304/g.126076  ORF Transcript_59304/g.126076 Transcript_59304/m.126076 type:complete len:218 (-) Transcript_59304:47-700(-)